MEDKDAKQEPTEAEIVEPTAAVAVAAPQPVLPQAVNLTPKQLRVQMKRDEEMRAVINEYIKNNMVSGKDYGTINIGGKESKPSLFKPGAEKFCGLFKIRPTFKKDPETVDMLGNTDGIIAYICELVDSRGRVIGEGRGSSSVDPKGKDFDVNKAIKIAAKRAQVDAVLRTGGLSDFFTQDMEDAPRDSAPASNGYNGSQTSMPASSSAPRTGGGEVPATEKQVNLISKLTKERFEDPTEFEEFAQDKVGATDDFTLKQASNLISDLFKLPKLETDEEPSY